MAVFLYTLSGITCLGAGGYLVYQLWRGEPVQIAVAALVVINYCLARSFGEWQELVEREHGRSGDCTTLIFRDHRKGGTDDDNGDRRWFAIAWLYA